MSVPTTDAPTSPSFGSTDSNAETKVIGHLETGLNSGRPNIFGLSSALPVASNALAANSESLIHQSSALQPIQHHTTSAASLPTTYTVEHPVACRRHLEEEEERPILLLQNKIVHTIRFLLQYNVVARAWVGMGDVERRAFMVDLLQVINLVSLSLMNTAMSAMYSSPTVDSTALQLSAMSLIFACLLSWSPDNTGTTLLYRAVLCSILFVIGIALLPVTAVAMQSSGLPVKIVINACAAIFAGVCLVAPLLLRGR